MINLYFILLLGGIVFKILNNLTYLSNFLKIYKILLIIKKIDYIKKNYINFQPGDFSVGVIPDPIPNSEVKPFSANGTLS